MSDLRPIAPISIIGIEPGGKLAPVPKTKWVKPTDLHIEEAYQRDLAERSVRLIRRIVQDWDWARMKPPICAEDTQGRLVVIDGQHTAIAAASHPGISKILVVIVDAEQITGRAHAFLGHNRDRVALTGMQIHFSAVAAGDEEAKRIDDACKKANVRVLRSPPPNGRFRVGETIAIKSIGAVARDHGVDGAARVLALLRSAQRAPIQANEIAAASIILFGQSYAGSVNDSDLIATVMSRSNADWRAAAARIARQAGITPRAALATLWFKGAGRLAA